MARYEKETEIPASAEDLYAWHMEPGAFERLVPPWQDVEVIERPDELGPGARLTMEIRFGGPLRVQWIAEHRDFIEGRQFVDVQIEGPFRSWEHRHCFEPVGPGRSILRDEIDYELPLGSLGSFFGGGIARRQLERMFDYRHRVTREAFESE